MAGTVIGTAVLELTSDTAEFRRGLAQAKGEIKQFGQAVDETGATTKRLTFTTEESREAFRRAGGDMSRLAAELRKVADENDGLVASQVREINTARSQAAAISQVTTATKATAAATSTLAVTSASASTGIRRLNEPLRILTQQAIGLHPAVGRLIDILGSLAFGSIVMTGVLAGMAALSLAWQKLTEDARKAKEEHEEALKPLKELLRQGEIAARGGEIRIGIDAARADLESAAARRREISGQISRIEAGPNQDLITRGAVAMLKGKLADAEKDYKEALALFVKGNQELARQAAEAVGKLPGGAAGPILDQTLPGVEGVATPPGNVQLNDLAMFLRDGVVPLKLPELQAQIRQFAADATSALSPLQERLVGVAESGIDAFTAFAFDASASFSEFVSSAIKDLGRLLLKLAIFETLGALFPGSNFIGALIGGVTGRASGGPVRQGQPYMVGERGPELFVPNSSGSIMPNAAMAGGGGVTLDFSRFPAASNPLAAARDSEWQRFLEVSLDHARQRGWK